MWRCAVDLTRFEYDEVAELYRHRKEHQVPKKLGITCAVPQTDVYLLSWCSVRKYFPSQIAVCVVVKLLARLLRMLFSIVGGSSDIFAAVFMSNN